MWSSLRKSKSVTEENLEHLIDSIVCSSSEKKLRDEITWNEWSTVTEKRMIRTGKKEEEKM